MKSVQAASLGSAGPLSIEILVGPPRTRWDWQLEAPCRFFGSTLFFGSDDETLPERVRREHQAKQICRTCPVKSHCRSYAIEFGETHGVWGGMSEVELRRNRRSRRPS
ncbi:WhiB family transcriptional regulator [Rhodococcus hoagii]|nr:WhiB family transcriptional regulator [Prescottella equi]